MNRIAIAATTLGAFAALAAAPATNAAADGCNPVQVQRLAEGLTYADGFLAALQLDPTATAEDIHYAQNNVTVTDNALTDARAKCDTE